MRRFWVLVALVVWSAGAAQAQTADLQPLLDRLERLEKDIKVLNRSVYKGEQPPSEALSAAPEGTAARLGVRLTELEEQLRSLTGSMERVSFQVDQVNQRLDQVMADIEFRLGSLEGGKPAGGAPRVASVPKAASVTAVPVEGGNQQVQIGSLGSISEKDLAAVEASAPKVDENQEEQTGGKVNVEQAVASQESATANVQQASVSPPNRQPRESNTTMRANC